MTVFYRTFILCFICMANVLTVIAQNNSDTHLSATTIPLEEVEKIVMPLQYNEALYQAELERREPGVAPKFAVNIAVHITPDTHGTWEDLPDHTSVWRVVIESPDAKSLNLGFGKYLMPQNGKLMLYSFDKAVVQGPFTKADNEDHEQLWTPIIEGDKLVIEVSLPTKSKKRLQLQLDYVNHDFIGFSSMASGSCNLDVICGEEDGWEIVDKYRDIIQSVAVISTGGGTFCTGFLVNNVENDCTPLFMTADHCGVSNQAPSLVTYWNFFNSECRQPNTPASGGNGDGVLSDFNTGSTLLATYSPTDFTLVELDDPVSPTANAFFAGWNATQDLPSDTIIAVHHPSTDEKRISFEFEQVFPSMWPSDDPVPADDATHVTVADWDIGTTEGGSSGSPLFDQNKRVIGQLHGGGAACGNDDSDIYGWIHASWEGGGSPQNRLKDWLDPNNTGTLAIDGRGQLLCSFFVDAAPNTAELCEGGNFDIEFELTTTEAFTSDVTLEIDNLPMGLLSNFSQNPVPAGGTSLLTIGNTGSLTVGVYNFLVTGTDNDGNSTTTELSIEVLSSGVSTPVLTFPPNAATDVSTFLTLEWQSNPNETYTVEVATDAAMTNIVFTETDIVGSSILLDALDTETTYFWRVKASSICAESPFTTAQVFTTADIACGSFSSEDIPVTIDEVFPGQYFSNLEINGLGQIQDIDVSNVLIEHSYIGDLIISLISPEGTGITLYDGTVEGCDGENISVSFDDDATLPYADLSSSCNATPPAAEGFYQPQEALSAFNGEDPNGIWQLVVTDQGFGDGGNIAGWDVDICTVSENTPTITASADIVGGCIQEVVDFTVAVGGGFDGPVTLSADNLPAGAEAVFSQNPADPGSVVAVQLINGGGVGGFSFQIIGTDGTNTGEDGLIWNIAGPPALSVLLEPLPDAMAVLVQNETFVWTEAPAADSYQFMIASDNLFNDIVEMENVTNTNYTSQVLLDPSTVYFWRVIAENECGTSISVFQSFTTEIVDNTTEELEAAYKIFPNPNNGQFTIQSSDSWTAPLQIEVFAADGRLVNAEINNQETGQYLIDLNDQSAGIYFVRLTVGDAAIVERILVE